MHITGVRERCYGLMIWETLKLSVKSGRGRILARPSSEMREAIAFFPHGNLPAGTSLQLRKRAVQLMQWTKGNDDHSDER